MWMAERVAMVANIILLHRVESVFSYTKIEAQKKPPQGQGEPVVAGVVRDTPTQVWTGVPPGRVINKYSCNWQCKSYFEL